MAASRVTALSHPNCGSMEKMNSSRNNTLPQVSAIVTTYNSADTVQRAIDSIRRQTMPDLELIVVDDASQDGTSQIVQTLDEPRLRFIQNERNLGIGGAKNVGIRAARGRFVAFLDSDDEWAPDKLNIQIAALAHSQSKVPLSFAAFWVHRAGGDKTVLRCPSRYDNWLRSIVLGETFSLGSTLFATRECFDTVGLFDEGLARLQDRDWTLRYLRQWQEFEFVRQPLAHIYNVGFPRPETVRKAVDALYACNEQQLRAHDPSLAKTFRTSLNFEVAVAEYRSGRVGSAVRELTKTLALDPAFAIYLGRRAWRKLLQGDVI
jgi:glycosyltransferase involved in cell wall biosynthesis